MEEEAQRESSVALTCVAVGTSDTIHVQPVKKFDDTKKVRARGRAIAGGVRVHYELELTVADGETAEAQRRAI